MARQARVVHGGDARVRGEELRDRLGIGVLALHAEREGLEPADEEIGGEWIYDRAGDPLQPPDGAHQLGRAQHRPGQEVVVAAQVLGGRVHDHVHSPLERPLVVRGREGGVDDRLHAVPPADGREPLQVEDAVVRIGGRLAHQHPGGRPDRVLERLVVARGHGGDLDAVARERLVQELPGAPVAVVGDHHVGAAREHGEERGGHRAHPAREEQALPRPLERGQLELRGALGRVAVAPVLDALDLAVEVVLQLLGVGEGVGGGLHDRGGQRVGRLGAGLAAVHRERAGAHRLLGRVHGLGLGALGHQGTSARAFSTWRAMARATRLASAGSSTGLFR